MKDTDMRTGSVPQSCYCAGQSLETFFAKASVGCGMDLEPCTMLQRKDAKDACRKLLLTAPGVVSVSGSPPEGCADSYTVEGKLSGGTFDVQPDWSFSALSGGEGVFGCLHCFRRDRVC